MHTGSGGGGEVAEEVGEVEHAGLELVVEVAHELGEPRGERRRLLP